MGSGNRVDSGKVPSSYKALKKHSNENPNMKN